MEGCLVSLVRSLKHADPVIALQNESDRLELSKSLINILFNVCFTRAIDLSQKLKKRFRQFDRLCLQLLDVSKDLSEKKRLLEENPELVLLIAEACPAKSL